MKMFDNRNDKITEMKIYKTKNMEESWNLWSNLMKEIKKAVYIRGVDKTVIYVDINQMTLNVY